MKRSFALIAVALSWSATAQDVSLQPPDVLPAAAVGALAESLTADFTAQPWRLPGSRTPRSRVGLTVKDIDQFEVTLPWGRMLEAEIRFGLVAQPLTATPRPPGPRVLQ